MSNCYKTSNNKYFQCPPRMSDGRHFTDYRSSDTINNMIRADNNISNSLNSKLFMQQNANALIEKQREHACELNCCGPCPITQTSKEPFDVGTMVPEQYMFITDGRTSKYVLNDVNGIGTGRNYFPLNKSACNNFDKLNSLNNMPKNLCASPLDNFSYVGDMVPQQKPLRNSIPGGGSMP